MNINIMMKDLVCPEMLDGMWNETIRSFLHLEESMFRIVEKKKVDLNSRSKIPRGKLWSMQENSQKY